MSDITIEIIRSNITIEFNEEPIELCFPKSLKGEKGDDGSGGFSFLPVNITSPTTYTVPAGKLLLAIAVVPAAGARNISIGYTAGATQVLDTEQIDSNAAASFLVNRYFNTAKTLHISGFTGQLIFYIL